MDKRSRIKDSSKKKRKRSGKKSVFEKDKRNSIRVEVNIDNPYKLQLVTLDGFKACDTIRDVKARVCREAINHGFSLPDPEIRSMYGISRLFEDNETLGSFFYPGCKDLTIAMFYKPTVKKIKDEPKEEEEEDTDWLLVCKFVRFREEAHEEDRGRDDDYMGDPVSIVKRPKSIQAPLPFAELHDLGLNGNYVLLNDQFSSIPISEIRHATFVSINVSVILLALNDDIHKNLVSLNGESEYLVVHVSWDKLSYFFLRLLRASYPDIPIVAVTDLDPHHLDLLTFLDTPPEKLPICYGWDLSRGFENFGVRNVDFLNIRWLGLRPSDCENFLPVDGVACPPPGFKEVIRMLRVNPFFRRKKDWLAALEWLNVFCLSDLQGFELASNPHSPIVFLKLASSLGTPNSDMQVLENIVDKLLEEHNVFVVSSKRST